MHRRISIFSDIHILKNPKNIYKEITNDWVDKFIKISKENNSDILFFLGDWHDNDRQISVDDLHFSNDCFSKLKNNFEKIFMITGNHDCYFRNSSLVNSVSHFHDGEQVFIFNKTEIVEIDNIKFCFVPWGEEPLKADFLMCHFDIQGFSLDNGRPSIHGKNKSELFNYSDFVVSGHYHRFQRKKYKDGTIMYLGSPFELNFGEEGKDSYFWIFDTESKSFNEIKNTWSPKHYNIFNEKDLIGKENNFIKIHKESILENLDRSKFKDVSISIMDSPILMGEEKIEKLDNSSVDINEIIDIVVSNNDTIDEKQKPQLKEKLKKYYETCKK
jgi:DNA repair exonuclease SbcCD nuclease subunit